MKPFEKWRFEEVELTFDIQRIKKFPILQDWLSSSYDLSPKEEEELENLQEGLIDYVEVWNEDELKFYFLGPLMRLVNYDAEKHYKSFLNRKLEATYNNQTLSGRVDFFLAKGHQIPREPFFFLHEYKPEPNANNDPLGQLLVAMVAAQKANKEQFPLYGAYVTGRFFFFVVLDGSEYGVSLAYDATKKDLGDIYAILQKVKEYIALILQKSGV